MPPEGERSPLPVSRSTSISSPTFFSLSKMSLKELEPFIKKHLLASDRTKTFVAALFLSSFLYG